MAHLPRRAIGALALVVFVYLAQPTLAIRSADFVAQEGSSGVARRRLAAESLQSADVTTRLESSSVADAVQSLFGAENLACLTNQDGSNCSKERRQALLKELERLRSSGDMEEWFISEEDNTTSFESAMALLEELAEMLEEGNFRPELAPFLPTDLLPDAPDASEGWEAYGRPVNETGKLISYLDPPAGVKLPTLSAQQLAGMAVVRTWNRGVGTVSAFRSFAATSAESLACGVGWLNEHFQDYWLGIPEGMYANGRYCGACARVVCVDAICPQAFNSSAVFQVVDSCSQCAGADVIMSAPGMLGLTQVNYDITPKVQVAWEYVPCAPFIQGGIKMLPSPNNDIYYVAINFSNLKRPIKAAALSGLPLTYQSYGSWVVSTPGQRLPLAPPYNLQLQAVTGQVLSVQIPLLQPTSLSVNFD